MTEPADLSGKTDFADFLQPLLARDGPKNCRLVRTATARGVQYWGLQCAANHNEMLQHCHAWQEMASSFAVTKECPAFTVWNFTPFSMERKAHAQGSRTRGGTSLTKTDKSVIE